MRTYRPTSHLLSDPWAPHPVVNRHVCSGDGGGAELELPDYSAQIGALGDFASDRGAQGDELYDEAKARGEELMETGREVSGRAGAAAESQQERSERLMGDWERRTTPILDAQAAEAMRMNADSGAYEQSQGGRYGTDAARSIDAQKAALQRDMLAKGQTGGMGGIAGQALDTLAATTRALGVTAATQQGVDAAKNERRAVANNALGQDQFTAGVGGAQGQAAAGNRGMQTGAMNAAAGTGASLYNPAIGMYGQQLGAYGEWGKSLGAQTQGALEKEKLAQESSGGGFLETVAPMVMGIGGSFVGGMGGPFGAAAGKSLFGATGGKIPGRRVPRGYANGGGIDTGSPHMVTPEMSPSGGAEVDDVHAMVSEGEFVIPERIVDWYGEQYFQKLIMKADKEREMQTVAAPEEVPMDEAQGQTQGIDMTPPAFRSEGARV